MLKKRLISLIIIISILFSALPMISFAEEQSGGMTSDEILQEYERIASEFEAQKEQDRLNDLLYTSLEEEQDKEDPNGTVGIMSVSSTSLESVDTPVIPESTMGINRNDYESVSIYDGSMSFDYPIVNLPGKNGMDLKLNLQYNSSMALHDFDGNIGKPQDQCDFGFALGWMFTAPKFDSDTNKNIVVLPDGQIMTKKWSNIASKQYFTDSNGGERMLQDVIWNSSINGVNYYDDRKTTKNGSINPTYTYEDRYGNWVKYDYSGNRLTKIYDSLGRSIHLNYNNSQCTVTLQIGTIVETLATIYLTEYWVDCWAVCAIDDAEYNRTTISYRNNGDHYNSLGTNVHSIYVPPYYYNQFFSNFLVYLIDEISYPTGGKSTYTYNAKKETVSVKYKLQNNQSYNFQIPYYKFSVDEQTSEGSGALIDKYVYSFKDFTSGNNKLRESTINIKGNFSNYYIYTFNLHKNPSTENFTTQDGKRITSFGYHSNIPELLTSKAVIFNENNNTRTSESWIYYTDSYPTYSKGLVKEYRDQHGKFTENTYYNYGLLNTSTLKQSDAQNAATIYEINNDLHTNGKAVSTSTITGQGLKVATDYDYDSVGQITEETVTKSEMVDSQYVDMGTLTTKYIYDYNKKTAQPVEMKVLNFRTNSDVVSASGGFTTIDTDLKTSYEYDFYDRLYTSKMHLSASNIHTTTYTYYDDGKPKQITNPDGSFVKYDYTYKQNSASNTITVTNTGNKNNLDNNQYITKSILDDFGFVLKQQEKNSNGVFVDFAEYSYVDGNVDYSIDTTGVKTSYKYDKMNRLKKVEYHENKASTIAISSINVNYNYLANGNLSKTVTDQFGYPFTTYYDKWGRVNKTEARKDGVTITTSQGFEYNWQNQVTEMLDANGQKIETEYDLLGCTTKVTNQLGEETEYKYGFVNSPIQVKTAGDSENNYKYDVLGRLLETEDALGQKQYYAYNAYGDIIKQIDRNGTVTSTSFHTKSRLPSMTSSANNSNYLGTQYHYYGLGQLKSVEKADGSDSVSYAYKYNNLISTVTENGRTMTYDYDAKNRLSTVVDYYNHTTTYGYNDPLSRLKTITQNNETITYSYNLRNELTSEQHGTSNLITYDYDEMGNLKFIQNGYYNNPNSYINRYDYIYDNRGNRRFETETVFGNTPVQKEYIYDDINRLKKEIYPDGSITDYSFDKNGNIALKEMQHPIGYSYNFKANDEERQIANISLHNTLYAYDANNRLINSTETIQGTGATYSGRIEAITDFDYDANGNTVRKEISGHLDNKVVDYVYNIHNQLTDYKEDGQTKGAYTYYADGMRKSKTVGSLTTDFLYRDGTIVNESIGGNVSAINYIGLTGIYARHSSAVSAKYLKNGHGDVVSLIENGVVTTSYDYDAYGNQKTLESNGRDRNPFRYCGEYYDDESGLIYLRARYYDPEMGRFLNEDPIRDGLNWYAYCGNNPIMYIDPSGLSVWLIHGTKISGKGGSPSTWTSDFRTYISKFYNNEEVFAPKWTGGNSVEARADAAENIAFEIEKWHKENPDDPIRIIAHSHGGNVAFMVVDILASKGLTTGAIEVETLITIATPIRSDYKMWLGKPAQHLNVYSNSDKVQISGGGINGGVTAKRTYDGATNVLIEGKGHSDMHSKVDVWKLFIAPLLALPSNVA